MTPKRRFLLHLQIAFTHIAVEIYMYTNYVLPTGEPLLDNRQEILGYLKQQSHPIV